MVTSVVEKDDKSATTTFDEEEGGTVVVVVVLDGAAIPLAATNVAPTPAGPLVIPVSSVRLLLGGGNFSLRRRFRGPCPCFE